MSSGITLIALIITIIILLILAAVTINVMLGDNGLFKTAKNAGEEYKIAGIRETVEAEILAMDAEKITKGEELTVEQALIGINEKGTFKEISLEESTGTIQGYVVTLGYNEQGKVVIKGIEKDVGTKIIITLNTEEYTKENIELEIGVKPEEIKITNVEVPNGIIKNEQGKYEVEKNGTYLIKVTLENKQVLEKELKIETIDKLPPKPFTITANTTETSIIITGETEDDEVTNEYASTGIDRYEYIVVDESGKETTYTTNEITGLGQGKYQVYMIAYDKVGNPSVKSNEVIAKINYYEWKKYSKKDTYGFRQTDWTEKDRTLKGDYMYYVDGFGDNLSIDLNKSLDRYTGRFRLNKSSSVHTVYRNDVKEPMYVGGYMLVWNEKESDRVYVTWDGVGLILSTGDPWTVKDCVVYASYKTGEYEQGDQYLGIVGSTNSEEYPQDGYQAGYWYVKIDN